MSSQNVLKKEMYFRKVLSQNAITVNWQRILDGSKLFAEYIWLNIPIFDLSQLGLNILLSTLPYEWQPFSVDFKFEPPTIDEAMQGIWANFEPIHYEIEIPWTYSIEEFIKELFKPEYRKDVTRVVKTKAYYGVSTYEGYIYDPTLGREFSTKTFHRFRLESKPDPSFVQTSNILADKMDIGRMVPEEVLARLRLLVSAQENAFVLGLGVLGKSRLGSKSS